MGVSRHVVLVSNTRPNANHTTQTDNTATSAVMQTVMLGAHNKEAQKRRGPHAERTLDPTELRRGLGCSGIQHQSLPVVCLRQKGSDLNALT